MNRWIASDLGDSGYRQIARVLAEGGLVCLPTDTVYGLAVDATNEEAIDHLFRLKGRSPSNPVLVLVDSVEMAGTLCDLPPEFDAIAARFWPGPITFVLKARAGVSARLTAGTGTIALRWPDSELAVRVVRELGVPITSTSANRSGEPAERTAEAISRKLKGVDLIVEGAEGTVHQVSTLVDLTKDPVELLREGPVSSDEITTFFSGHRERQSA